MGRHPANGSEKPNRLTTPLRLYSIQWANLQSTCRDENYNDFAANFLEDFLTTSKQVLRDGENYEIFLNEKAKTTESLKEKLGKLAQNVWVALEAFQTVTSVVAGSAPVQAIMQNQSVPVTIVVFK